MSYIKIFLLYVCILCSTCTTKTGLTSVEEKGYLIYRNSSFWQFIPAKSVNIENCHEDFTTDNLKPGIGLNYPIWEDISSLLRTFDTLKIDNIQSRHSQDTYLKISPVTINYQVNEKYISSNRPQKTKISYVIKGKTVKISYDQYPVKINKITPLFCLNKREEDITECRCHKSPTDPNDYLFKICNYLKDKDRFTLLPSYYQIKKIQADSIDGKKTIKVELTCCYLGDVAYFDPDTDEIISFKYGAK